MVKTVYSSLGQAEEVRKTVEVKRSIVWKTTGNNRHVGSRDRSPAVHMDKQW